MTHSRPAARALLESVGLEPRRDLGQNFVVDPNTVRRIVTLAGIEPGERVIEIGAGLGSLTLALVERGARVTTVEVDHRLVTVLRRVLAGAGAAERVDVIEGDAMKLDWGAVLAGHHGWPVVANLPYNVATPLVCDLLDCQPAMARFLVMVQREVGERMAARPGDAAYGAVSVKIAYWASAEVVGLVPPTVFLPQPNVTSALVRIVRREPPPVDTGAMFALVRTAFGQRRKMLRRSLAGVVSSAAFEAGGIDPARRPETLGVDEWCALTLAAGADLAS